MIPPVRRWWCTARRDRQRLPLLAVMATSLVQDVGMVSEGELVAWLRLTILLDKSAAMAATPGPWEPEGDDPTDDQVMGSCDGHPSDGWTLAHMRGPESHENMLHVAANDPQDTIARCEAELAILDEHRPELIDYRDGDGIERASRECIACEQSGTPDNYPCRTVRLLASGYKYRPGYREEDWEP
jgi:hypothetical protein